MAARRRLSGEGGRRAAVLLLGATGFGIFGACGGSTDRGAPCNLGDTRICVGDGRCEGAQSCLEDQSGFGRCVCEPNGAGGVSGSGAGGAPAAGRGGSGPSAGGVSGASGSSPGTGGIGVGAIGGGLGSGGSSAGSGGSCASVRIEAQPNPLDVFILLDQSGSMVLGQDRWTPILSAIKVFINSPDMAGVGVGLGYFGLHPPGQPPTDPTSPGSCNANDYARPEVPIDVLPNVRQAIETSLNLHNTPGGGTPTHPALQGAMQYVTSWGVAHPDRQAIVVLATDGEPQGCTGNDINTVSQVAAAGVASNPSIRTYVIGVGPNLEALNRIAQAGGSTQAYLVDGGNTNQFLEALRVIRGIAIGCELAIPAPPSGVTLDLTQINIFYTPPGGAEGIIYHVASAADCRPDIGGWYYERGSQGTPSRIKFCPASCNALVNGGGRLDIAVGCTSVVPP